MRLNPTLTRSDTGEGIQAAGGPAGAAERREVFGPAHGAEIRRVDAARRYAGLEQLGAVGGHQIDMRAALEAELRGDLRPDFVTAGADGRANGGVEIARIGGEAAAHGLNRAKGDTCHGAAPAGMHRSEE